MVATAAAVDHLGRSAGDRGRADPDERPGERGRGARPVQGGAQLAADRRTALAQEQAADRALDTHLPPVDLPSWPRRAAPAERRRAVRPAAAVLAAVSGGVPRRRSARISARSSVSGSSSVLSHIMAFQKITGTKASGGHEPEHRGGDLLVRCRAQAARHVVEVRVEAVVGQTDDVGEDPEHPHGEGGQDGAPQVPERGTSGGDATSSSQSPRPKSRRVDRLERGQPAVTRDAATAAGVCQATTTARSKAMKASDRGSSRWRAAGRPPGPGPARASAVATAVEPAARPRLRQGAPRATRAGTTMARSENCSASAYSVGGPLPRAVARARSERDQCGQQAPAAPGSAVVGPPAAAPSLTGSGGAGRSPRGARRTGSRGEWRRSVPGCLLRPSHDHGLTSPSLRSRRTVPRRRWRRRR